MAFCILLSSKGPSKIVVSGHGNKIIVEESTTLEAGTNTSSDLQTSKQRISRATSRDQPLLEGVGIDLCAYLMRRKRYI